MRTRKGFTIVELVVVIAVIAILAAVLIPTFSGVVEKTDRNTALKLAEAAYKEARAEANKDGSIIAGEEATVDGFKFRFAAEAASAEVILYPDTFEYILNITNDKITTPGKRDDFQPDQNAPVVAATGVTMYRPGITLEVGQTEVLHVSIAPANATNKNVTWSTSDANIATVSNGLVTAVSEGTATITAKVETAEGYKTDTCTVTVERVKVKFVSLNALNMSFTLGDVGRQLTATVKPNTVAAPYNIVKWKSANERIATVDENTGLVTPKSPGYTEITATADEMDAKCGIMVNGFVLDDDAKDLVKGSIFNVPFTIYPANTDINWTSDNEGVAVVSDGVVTARGAGTAKITATAMGITETLTVTVTGGEPSVTGITLDQTSAYVAKDATITLTATAPTGSEITWESDNSKVSIVSSNDACCVLKGVETGTAKITATMTGEGEPKTATCSVTVYESAAEPSYTVSINPESVSIIDGDTITLINEEINPPEGTTVEWASSNNDVATVESGGVVIAKKPGTAIISVVVKQGDTVVAVDSCIVTVKAISVTVEIDSTHAAFSGATTAASGKEYKALLIPVDGYRIKSIEVEIGGNTVAHTYDNGTGVLTIAAENVKGGNITIDIATESVEQIIIPVAGVALNKNAISLVSGNSEALGVIIAPGDATDQSVTWTSSNTSVASVNSSGVVTAHNNGEATITVTTSNGLTANCIVTVTGAGEPVTGISLNEDTLELEEGDTRTLTATVVPFDATNKNIIWKSDKPGIASVNADGVVTGVSAGTTTIVAITEDGNHIAVCMVTVTTKSDAIVHSVSFVTDSEQNVEIESSTTVNDGEDYILVLKAGTGSVITEYTATVNGKIVASKTSEEPHARTFQIEIKEVSGDITITAIATDIFTGKSYFTPHSNVAATNYTMIDMSTQRSFVVAYTTGTISENDGSVEVYVCDENSNKIDIQYNVIKDKNSFRVIFDECSEKTAYVCYR